MRNKMADKRKCYIMIEEIYSKFITIISAIFSISKLYEKIL